MSTSLANSHRIKTRPMVAVIALIGFVLAIVYTQSKFAVPLSAEAGSTSKTHGPSQNRIEAELITIKVNGFDPTEIKRPPGRFILAVNNLSGVSELDLRLDREQGPRQREVRLPRGRLAWKESVDLSPGTQLGWLASVRM